MSSVRILVLGDLGCSPRMKNHCISFSKSGWKVYFSGYVHSDLSHSLTNNENIIVDPIKESPPFINQRKERIIFLFLKVLFTTISLFFFLLKCQWTDIIMIQNPPAVPTFLVVWLISKIRRINVMIDWHNYGYTLMNKNRSHGDGMLTKFYKNIEVKFSHRLQAEHFCVSKAFLNDLLLKWKIKANLLYDWPWKVDGQRNMKLIHDLIMKLGQNYPVLKSSTESDKETALTTTSINGNIQYKVERPALIVSSCSWTIDDDFDTLFKALDQYNKLISAGEKLPNLICVITGRGPLKNYFKRIISEQEWCHVSVITPWLEIDDYPIMLSAADIGICLHNSTSGLDLPMKIVDMFSVGLPVLALNYKCLHELLIDQINGRLFSGTDGLVKHLVELLSEMKSKKDNQSELSIIDRYRDNIVNHSRHGTWQEHWEEVVLSAANDLINCRHGNDKQSHFGDGGDDNKID